MKQEFIIEKLEKPFIVSKPWQVRCVGNEGPFKSGFILGVFRTKKRAQELVNAHNEFVESCRSN